MEADVIAPMAVFFFSIALLTFWFKKRWKKKPEPETKEPEPVERDSRKFTYDKPPERESDEQ